MERALPGAGDRAPALVNLYEAFEYDTLTYGRQRLYIFFLFMLILSMPMARQGQFSDG